MQKLERVLVRAIDVVAGVDPVGVANPLPAGDGVRDGQELTEKISAPIGDRFVLTPGGQLIEDECPKGMCVSAIAEISKVLPAIYERLISKSDPNFEREAIVQCPDTGLDKGGWGKILMKVYVEPAS